MELRHLRYFVAVAEELNFRRAAERLCMEQPPLSRQIQQLEAELGVLLFERERRRVALTLAGEAFLEEARRTLAQADYAVYAARQAGQRTRQHLSVNGCFCLGKYSHAFDSAYGRAVRGMRERHSDLRLTLTEVSSSEQERALRVRQADAAFLQSPVTDATLISHSLLREALVLALPQEHPAAALPSVSLASLGHANLFLFPEFACPSLHQDILAACARAGFRPRSIQDKDSPQRALWLAGAGMGVTFVGASFTTNPPAGVVFRPVQEFPLHIETVIAWRRDNASAVLAEFIALVKEALSDQPSG